VADLSCLHRQHVRHNPPFRLAPWVLDEAGRASRIGADLDCPLCDRAELPDGLQVVRTTEVWDEGSAPPALRRAHRLGASVWGRLRVQEGRLRFRASTEPPLDVVVGSGTPQAIPPEVDHELELGEPVRFLVELLKPSGATGRASAVAGPPR
jgi:tellurite resistance-related uncharacterized protein